ncbi:hypothetical protein G3A43_08090 [Paraburkholderia aspalathi]|nr:hypothetical protein [Paraburkholderia aspalathi]MBK3780216.1 hypothetical protein [Paraburkholderia aspalathi]
MEQFIGFLITWPLLTCLNGWVISVMWRWFIVPFGAPEIGVAWAIGLTAVATMFCDTTTGKDESFIVAIAHDVLKAGLMLLVAYIAHRFMHLPVQPPVTIH